MSTVTLFSLPHIRDNTLRPNDRTSHLVLHSEKNHVEIGDHSFKYNCHLKRKVWWVEGSSRPKITNNSNVHLLSCSVAIDGFQYGNHLVVPIGNALQGSLQRKSLSSVFNYLKNVELISSKANLFHS